MKTFEELGVRGDLRKAIEEMGFEHPMPVQEKVIPHLLNEDGDVVALAQTGTGKTAAFGLPVLQRLNPSANVPQALIIAPTRELCLQIGSDLADFSKYMPAVRVLPVYGGSSIESQIRSLRQGVQVIVATPGRLLDHIQMGYVDLSRVSFFILDEADRMLDMGFYDDIMAIARLLPQERQTLLFSATMPPKIRKLAQSILRDPVEVKIAPSRPVEKIAQSAIFCNEDQKESLLIDMLKGRRGQRVIVFAASKHGVRDLARTLRRAGIKAAEIHSDLDQQQRDETIRGFRSGRIEVIVATDLLARGIDIDEVMLVINYDVPREPEDYVHRVGRTARANADGEAVTLVGPRDRRAFSRVESTLKIEIPAQNRPAQNRPSSSARRQNSGRPRRDSSNGPASADNLGATSGAANSGNGENRAKRNNRGRGNNHRRNPSGKKPGAPRRHGGVPRPE